MLRPLLLALVALAVLAPVALPAAPNRSVAILVVGPWAKAQSPDEVTLLRRVEDLLSETGHAEVRPVRYHFDQPAERKHCEKVLGIQKADLLFVGIVQLDSRGAVSKVLERIDQAQDNLEVSAQEAVYRWRKRAGVLPAGE